MNGLLVDSFILSSTKHNDASTPPPVTPQATTLPPILNQASSESNEQFITPEGGNCSRELMYPNSPLGLTNGDRFQFSFIDHCDNIANQKQLQPFSVNNMKPSFSNPGGLIINKKGFVYFNPSWLTTPIEFQLTCQPGGHNYAFTKDNIFISIEFVLGRPISTIYLGTDS
ncbi:hypothetical protein PPL_03557 [Heterostelium album PN500]|uniref:Uncharacterized protein n=1 Tax=Heterostelium pallidum (strain ATCC 26659 / Pp 5 / PN500) TaxID=670386 RepID=D3B546_HETP5|nr:hypothetical protein PPL_03557 [Heterostelium album PN500]EFA83411.1 hypothetical protein PPL_03557 [Heterostelium album PN500]|eukprot:XP_020435528.1 hypothetical protein PPL_03557 [Heterostelium album PN500]